MHVIQQHLMLLMQLAQHLLFLVSFYFLIFIHTNYEIDC